MYQFYIKLYPLYYILICLTQIFSIIKRINNKRVKFGDNGGNMPLLNVSTVMLPVWCLIACESPCSISGSIRKCSVKEKKITERDHKVPTPLVPANHGFLKKLKVIRVRMDIQPE